MMRSGSATRTLPAVVMKLASLVTALVTAAILACAPGAAGVQAPAQLEPANDLAAAARFARARSVPILLAFTEAGCPYCARARNDYLVPLQASAAYGTRIVIREIDIRRNATLRSFDGTTIAPAALARRYRVTLVPTVVVVDYGGRLLTEPVVGLLGEDFYQTALERAIDAAHLKLKQ